MPEPVLLRFPTFVNDGLRRVAIKYGVCGPAHRRKQVQMDWKAVVDGVGKATLALLVVEVLARLAMAFGVSIEGVAYLDLAFVTMVAATIAGYGVYYGRTFRFPGFLLASVISGFAGLVLVFTSIVAVTFLQADARTILFWLGALLLALSVPLGSLGVRQIKRTFASYTTDIDFGRHVRNLTDEFGGCADGRKEMPSPDFAEPVACESPGRVRGAGFDLRWNAGSVVFKSKDSRSLGVTGSADLETEAGPETVDGICIVLTTCPTEYELEGARPANDGDAQEHDFKTLQELKDRMAQEAATMPEEAESLLNEALKKYKPEEASQGERVSIRGVIDVRKDARRKVVKVPGVYVYKGPEGEVVRVGGSIVHTKVSSEGAILELSGVYREGEKPVTIAKNVSAGCALMAVGPRWFALKRDEAKEGSGQ